MRDGQRTPVCSAGGCKSQCAAWEHMHMHNSIELYGIDCELTVKYCAAGAARQHKAVGNGDAGRIVPCVRLFHPITFYAVAGFEISTLSQGTCTGAIHRRRARKVG